MNIKHLSIVAALALLPTFLGAQTTREEFVNRYNMLSSKLGPAGVGIETLIEKWEAAYPDDIDMTTAKYAYYFYKSAKSTVVQLSQDRYLGREPILPYTDSLGVKRNWFEDTVYDDSLFAIANTAAEKAIALHPERLDLRFMKLNGLMNYEKESPDMTLSELGKLVDYHFSARPKWIYNDVDVTDELFKGLMQEYCYSFFRIGSPSAAEAFKSFSEKMLQYYPSEALFMDNIGSYYLVFKGDTKSALKYYNKVLKKHPDDITAIRNSILAARKTKNIKLEKKYLPMLVKYGETEADRNSAAIRLQALGG